LGPERTLNDNGSPLTTDAVSASFEICDARIRDWKCPYPDFFADNGFSARIVLSGHWVPVCEVDLLGESVVLLKDGERIAEGRGEMALGHPANAVAGSLASSPSAGAASGPAPSS
jgi:2-keto-4-pentenoate hydratase